MRFAPYSLVLVTALVGGSKCDEKECACQDDVFEFEVSGQGASMRLYDADGEEVQELVIDAGGCACAKSVTIAVTHRDGLELRAPEPGDGCMLSDASPDAATVEITFQLGSTCEFEWFGLGPDPTKPIPIVIKPP